MTPNKSLQGALDPSPHWAAAQAAGASSAAEFKRGATLGTEARV